MSINPIQFQRGLSLPDFLSQYGTEAQCESALEKVRWRDGFRCPQCGHDHCTVFRRGQQPLYQCSACHHQTSLRVGTLFQASKLPLTTWFLAIYLITQAKNGVSALELMRSLGISWRAAWRLKHKILRAMLEQEADRVLRGRVEVDDAYLGGTRSGKRGRGAAGKRPFVIAVETRPNPEGGLPHPVYVRPLRSPAGFLPDNPRALGGTGIGCRYVDGLRWIGRLPGCRSAGHTSSAGGGSPA